MSRPNPSTTALLKNTSSSVYVCTEVLFLIADYTKRNPGTKKFTDVARAILEDILKDELSTLRKSILKYEDNDEPEFSEIVEGVK